MYSATDLDFHFFRANLVKRVLQIAWWFFCKKCFLVNGKCHETNEVPKLDQKNFLHFAFIFWGDEKTQVYRSANIKDENLVKIILLRFLQITKS